MDYTAKMAALASVIAYVAPRSQHSRMQESMTYSEYQMGVFEWFTSKMRVRTEGTKVTLSYPSRAGRLSAQQLDAWATSLIESAMGMLEGSPYEIDYRVGVIEFERPGVTSYQI